MNQYWDVGFFVETKSGKKFWRGVGSAKQTEDGGFWLNLDAYPAAGQSLLVKPQQERGAGGGFGGQSRGPATDAAKGPRRDQPGTGTPFKDDDFDSIPF